MKRIPLPDHVVAMIRGMHQTDDRKYHDWSHPVHMIEMMSGIRHLLHDPSAVLFANILHDVIMEFTRKDNEERSAVFAEQCLQGHAPQATIARTAGMIRSSAGHLLPEGLSPEDESDNAYFLDLDLAVLGSDPIRFDAYEDGIRHEYRHVPEEQYVRVRSKILESFLSRKNLYFTDWARTMFEARARRNLIRSIARLRASA